MEAISLLIAMASLAVSFVSLCIATYGISRANKTSSAATLVTLNEGFRQAWVRYLDISDDKRDYELAELLNLLEIACAIYLEKSLTGNSRELMSEYVDGILNLLKENKGSYEALESKLRQSETTFKFIKKFIYERRMGSA